MEPGSKIESRAASDLGPASGSGPVSEVGAAGDSGPVGEFGAASGSGPAGESGAASGSGARYAIGELCQAFGVTPRALRFYEDERLIAPERRGTARLYSDRDRARLGWILRGKRVGFSLNEIRELLDLYDVGDHRQTQRRVTIERCRERIAALTRQKDDIDATIAELEDFLATLGANQEMSD